MIKLIKRGYYRLVETKRHHKILYLGKQGYAWNYARGIGELLTYSKTPHKQAYRVSQGPYRIYDVKNDPNLVDLKHLELALNPNRWQGYLLLTDLPDSKKIRSRILPTNEVISA